MRIRDWSSDVGSSDLYRARHRARLGPHQTMHAREGRAIIGRIEDRRYEDQSDSDMPFVDPIAEKKDRRAERHNDRGRGQHVAPVDAAEKVGQIADKPGADDPPDPKGASDKRR